MTTNEYMQILFDAQGQQDEIAEIDEVAACEVAQLVSGSFTYLLYEAVWINHIDIESVSRHIERLYESENHFGLVYFIFLLSNSVELIIPLQYSEMTANYNLVPILSAAVYEDWMECVTEYQAA